MAVRPDVMDPPGGTEDLDWPAEIHRVLREHDVSLVSYVPDAGHARLIRRCQQDPAMTTFPLTTEEEGIGVAAGGWLGGARAVLLMQSSGVGNCVNTLSLARTCGFPLLMLVTMRGEWGEFNPWQVPMGQATPGVLETCGVIVHRASEPEEVARTVDSAARLAFKSYNAVAVLLSQRLIGAKSFDE